MEKGQINFIESCPPPLKSGSYTITMTQEIENSGLQVASYQYSNTFIVTGERFSIDSTEVYSVYPPANSTGDFSNTLPHIVLNRRSLPWERELFKENPNIPWICLLVLDQEDNAVSHSLTVKEFLEPGKGFLYPEKVELFPDTGEKKDDSCMVVEIPGALFQKVIPSQADLIYLAHVRKVNTENKATGGGNSDGWFSCVIGNRFPAAGVNRVHLVSLEGFQNYLPQGGKTFDHNLRVRLVSLAKWSFSCDIASFDFMSLITKLNQSPKTHDATLRIHKANTGNSTVDKALQMGYVPMNHTTKTGDKIVSWYRGPFIPFRMPQEPIPTLHCADEALRYDPDTGLFDVSYAAAWQLGRLLALQNPSFAVSLYKWRLENHRSALNQYKNNVILQKCERAFKKAKIDLADSKKRIIEGTEQNLLVKLMLDFWEQYLVEKIIPTDRSTPILGGLADPTGLREMVGKLPGLISSKDFKKIRPVETTQNDKKEQNDMTAKNDIIEAIHR